VDLFRATSDPYGEATSLSHLGDSHDAIRDDDARLAWMRAGARAWTR
jgi:hypothetical protein